MDKIVWAVLLITAGLLLSYVPQMQTTEPYYVIEAHVDKPVVPPGEQIVFTGRVSELVSVEPLTLKPVANAWVRLFLLEAGVTTEIGAGTYTDGNGNFTIACAAPMENGGHTYMVMAYFGANSAAAYVNVTVVGGQPVAPTPEYTVQFVVKDQCGNPLPAKVTFDGTSVSADKTGVTIGTKVSKTTLTATAEINVGTETYSTTVTFSITASMTKEIVINRRFYWTFFINYTEGTLATGNLTASSAKETLTVPITNGYGEAYLTDATYTFSFEASPAVTLKTMTVTNDGNFVATINKENRTAEEISSNQTSTVTTPPVIPWILIPNVYIYSLLGVLVIGLIIIAVVRMRRPSR